MQRPGKNAVCVQMNHQEYYLQPGINPAVLTEDDLRVKNIARADIGDAIPRMLTDLTLPFSGHWFLLDTESAFQTSFLLTGLVSFLLL